MVKNLTLPQEFDARKWYSYYAKSPDLIDSQISQLENILDGDFSNLLVRKEIIHAKLEILRDLKKELWGNGDKSE